MKKLKQFFRHHRLSKEWRIVRHPATILAMEVVKLGVVEYLADKRAIKDRFIRFGQIRNESDGRMVVISASSAGKMLGASGADIRRLAAAFDVLFKRSLHVWTEPETDEPGHKRHPDVLWYHQYVCRFDCDMGEYFVALLQIVENRFAPRRPTLIQRGILGSPAAGWAPRRCWVA